MPLGTSFFLVSGCFACRKCVKRAGDAIYSDIRDILCRRKFPLVHGSMGHAVHKALKISTFIAPIRLAPLLAIHLTMELETFMLRRVSIFD